MIQAHLITHKIASVVYVATTPLPSTSDSTQATEALTSAMNQLAQKLNTLPQFGQGWIQPATHFVDTLPLYNPITLSMVLIACVILSSSLMIAWTQYRKNKHQQDMVKAMSVPIEAFISMVQQSAASTELLGRRIEGMSEQMSTMSENVSRLSDVLTEAVEHVSAIQNSQINISSMSAMRT